MANLCAPLPVTVPPAPAPSRLRAGPLPGGRASRLPSQWGVGKGRVGGEEREEVGKRGGGAVVFQGGEGSSSLSSACLSSLGANPLPSKVATFLHLGRAETFASNWDSLGRGILSFSFSFAPFLPSRFPFPSSSPFLPPLTGVYLQSLQWARVPRGEDYYTESQGDFAGGFTSLFKILKQCLQRLVNFGGVRWRGIGAAGRSEALTLKLCWARGLRENRDCQPWKNSPVVPVQPGWRRQRERAWKADVQLCPTRRSTAHWEPLERACAEQSLGQTGGGRSCFLATLINLLGIAPSEGIRLDSPWRETTPLQKCWAAVFSHSPKFLGWDKIRGECCIISILIIRCFYTACWQRPSLPHISSFLVLLVVSRHNVFYRTSSFFLKLNK